MTFWSPLSHWFTLRVLLLLAMLLAPGCGYSVYHLPPAELQRLTQLPPSQRGNYVRVPSRTAPVMQAMLTGAAHPDRSRLADRPGATTWVVGVAEAMLPSPPWSGSSC